MRVIAWLVEGTWPACVDAVRAHAPEDAAGLREQRLRVLVHSGSSPTCGNSSSRWRTSACTT
ncbi:hypothetical protein ACWEGQ_36070, partial [Streptomyces seoulensis]